MAGSLSPFRPFRRHPSGGQPYRDMVLDYRDELRLFPSIWSKVGLVALVFLYWYLPTHGVGTVGILTLTLVGIFAIGAIGLNLLSGFTGQISLGHAFFIGVGTYTAAYLGVDREWPLLLYLAAAAVIGFTIGAIIGPFALRLRGVYLVIVTLGLVFLGRHIFNNWDSVTGGNRGTRIAGADMSIGSLDFGDLTLFGHTYTREAGLFFLVWALVALAALVAKNIVRSRPGRAMQAVRDRDLSAEVIGVSLARTKIAAFAWSSAFAAVAGVLSGLYIRQAGPDDFGLFLSITYIAVIIIGGVGTIIGSILGALFVIGGEELIRQNGDSAILDPIVTSGPADATGLFTVGEFNAILFGLFIVLFLMFEPRGLVALWFRIKTWFMTWPFSY
jgi:branched-chain amino acid transport system permease protein